LIARAIANGAQCCFISISGSEFVKKYVGTGAMTVRSIFNFAHKMAREIPVIIYIDEIDGLGTRKGLEGSGAQTEYNNTINEILRQMDGFLQFENIMVIGATNLIEVLDPALLRSGRFDRKIFIPLPGREDREKLIRHYFEKINVAKCALPNEAVSGFAKRMIGCSGADVENFSNESAMIAARNADSFVRRVHIDEALDKILLGAKRNFCRSKQDLLRTAYHEAGHALIAALTGVPIAKVSILPRRDALGLTLMFGKEIGETMSRDDLLRRLMCLYGGFLAEEIMYGKISLGVSDDLEKASMTAKNMIQKYGMGKDGLEAIAYSAISSEHFKQKFDSEVIVVLKEAISKAKSLLISNKDRLRSIAMKLMEKETISGCEVASI
jgi:cell division protease FtsH